MADPPTERHDVDADEATLSALRRLGAVPPPRAAFARALKEELMQAPITSRSPVPAFPRLRPPSGIRPLASLVPPLRRSAWSALATAALLVVTMLGAVLAILVPGGADDDRLIASAPPAMTPGASPIAAETCETTDLYFGCRYLIDHTGSSLVVLSRIDAASRDVSDVQLQGWAIAPGASIAGADADDAARGVVVDFVLSGAYVATFDVPVVVFPGGITDNIIQYLDAGATVELGRGDTVTYQLGGLVEAHNPLQTQRVELKRAVIYDGDISRFSTTAPGVTTRVEADGRLPQPLATYDRFGPEVSVDLWYLQVYEESFPPKGWQSRASLMLGPVDPQMGPAGTEGFVLVIQGSPGG